MAESREKKPPGLTPESDNSLLWGPGKNELDNRHNPKKSVLKILGLDAGLYSLDLFLLYFLTSWNSWVWVFWAILAVGLVWACCNLAIVATDRYRSGGKLAYLQYFTCFRLLGIISMAVVLLIVLLRVLSSLLGGEAVPHSKFPGGAFVFIILFLVVSLGQMLVQYFTGPKYFRGVKHWEIFEGYEELHDSKAFDSMQDIQNSKQQ